MVMANLIGFGGLGSELHALASERLDVNVANAQLLACAGAARLRGGSVLSSAALLRFGGARRSRARDQSEGHAHR